jgi:hypothetical protein
MTSKLPKSPARPSLCAAPGSESACAMIQYDTRKPCRKPAAWKVANDSSSERWCDECAWHLASVGYHMVKTEPPNARGELPPPEQPKT